jgi:hypothetical protein
VKLFHHESASRGYENTPEKLARFNREVAQVKSMWPDRLQNDPFYNPNLTREWEDFTLDMDG